MKQVLFLLLVSVFTLPAFHSEAQVQGTSTPPHYQELTKQQQRQVKRDLRKKAREIANQQAFNAAVDALKDRNWVLMPVHFMALEVRLYLYPTTPTSSNLKEIQCTYN